MKQYDLYELLKERGGNVQNGSFWDVGTLNDLIFLDFPALVHVDRIGLHLTTSIIHPRSLASLEAL